jgi:hypothetical protein
VLKVDVHTHFLPEPYVQILQRHGINWTGGVDLPAWTPQLHLDFIDQWDIDVSVLSCIAEGGVYFGDQQEASELGIPGIVIPGTPKDWYYILEGLLDQETSLRPTEITSDTAGASEMGFGTFRMLGWQFSPRLADAGSATLYRVDPAARYGPLQNLTRTRINTGLLRERWDDLLRVAGSLLTGAVRPSELFRYLTSGDRIPSWTPWWTPAGTLTDLWGLKFNGTSSMISAPIRHLCHLGGTPGPGKVGDARSRPECSHCQYCWSIVRRTGYGGFMTVSMRASFHGRRPQAASFPPSNGFHIPCRPMNTSMRAGGSAEMWASTSRAHPASSVNEPRSKTSNMGPPPRRRSSKRARKDPAFSWFKKAVGGRAAISGSTAPSTASRAC